MLLSRFLESVATMPSISSVVAATRTSTEELTGQAYMIRVTYFLNFVVIGSHFLFCGCPNEGNFTDESELCGILGKTRTFKWFYLPPLSILATIRRPASLGGLP